MSPRRQPSRPCRLSSGLERRRFFRSAAIDIGDLAERYFEDRAREGKKDYVKVRRYIWEANLKRTFGAPSTASWNGTVEAQAKRGRSATNMSTNASKLVLHRQLYIMHSSLIRPIVNWADRDKLVAKVYVLGVRASPTPASGLSPSSNSWRF